MTSTHLFAGRAAEYARYRTDYPEAVIRAAFEGVGLEPSDVVADLGSGTGMLSRWLLERGNQVFGVEPDSDMRAMAERSLFRFGASFHSVDGTAERTSLPDGSVTLVTAGNAFHYFEPEAARAEVGRILQPDGRVLLIGHDVVSEPNPFMRAYLDFIAGIASREASAFHDADRLSRGWAAFFGDDGVRVEELGDFSFRLSWEQLRGRFLSTSVAPQAEDPRRPEVLSRLNEVFVKFQEEDAVIFQLRWQLIAGRIA